GAGFAKDFLSDATHPARLFDAAVSSVFNYLEVFMHNVLKACVLTAAVGLSTIGLLGQAVSPAPIIRDSSSTEVEGQLIDAYSASWSRSSSAAGPSIPAGATPSAFKNTQPLPSTDPAAPIHIKTSPAPVGLAATSGVAGGVPADLIPRRINSASITLERSTAG